jgi:hypothetical protein
MWQKYYLLTDGCSCLERFDRSKGEGKWRMVLGRVGGKEGCRMDGRVGALGLGQEDGRV